MIDLSSKKLTVALWCFVLFSAVAVVFSSHSARGYFITWQSELKKEQDYNVEWGELLIEKSALASYARLENVAKQKLKMVSPDSKAIVIVEEEAK